MPSRQAPEFFNGNRCVRDHFVQNGTQKNANGIKEGYFE
jgi:hypothetical protein